MIDGGDGDDVISLGFGDWASGGDGADQFELSGADATVTDFDPTRDQLWVLYDPAQHANPELTVIEDGPDALVGDRVRHRGDHG